MPCQERSQYPCSALPHLPDAIDPHDSGRELEDGPVHWEWLQEGSIQYLIQPDVMSSVVEELPPRDELVFCYKDLNELLDAKLILSFAFRICRQRGQAFLYRVFAAWSTAICSLPQSEVNAVPGRLSRAAEKSFLTRCLDLLHLEAADFHDGHLPGEAFVEFLRWMCATSTIDLVMLKMDVATVEKSFPIQHEIVKSQMWKLVKGEKPPYRNRPNDVRGGLSSGLGAELLMALIEKGLPRWCWAGCIGPFNDNLLQYILEPADRGVAIDAGKAVAEGRLCIFLARNLSLEELCHQNQDRRNALSYAEDFAEHYEAVPMLAGRGDVWIAVRDVIRTEMEGDLLQLAELARSARAGLGGRVDLPAFDDEIWRRAATVREEWLRMGWRFLEGTECAQISEVLSWHLQAVGLATVGWIATDLGFRFPGEKFQAVANSVEAHDKMVEAGYMLPFFGAIGIFELFALWLFFQSWPIGDGINREAGDYWLGKQFLPKDPAKEKDMRLKELENGRLAMFAFSGIVTQAVITGKTWPFM
ncbi:LI818 [Symbiodinium sp. CCMP2592]|nr:LI818 [Symbiodinium sp. CCMP2592]